MKSIVLTLILIACNVEFSSQTEFTTLKCPERRNITIVINALNWIQAEKILFEVSKLVFNEECFMINLYLPEEDRIIRLRKDTNLNNIERSFKLTPSRNGISIEDDIKPIENNRTLRLIDNLRKEKILGNEGVKQSFVYMVDAAQQEEIYKKLRYLQNVMYWDVIIYCKSFLCPLQGWIPPNRLKIFQLERVFEETEFKNLLDVIKEPSYDRYQFYQTLALEPDFFNETCLRKLIKFT